MQIQSLKLYTQKLGKQKHFFNQVLGFKLINSDKTKFTIQLGESVLTFIKSEQEHIYHYCFLIPRNTINISLEWLKRRGVSLIKSKGEHVHQHVSWNAESIYFFDGAGNLAEFIARHDLPYESGKSFNTDQIINLNEIGIPTENIGQLNNQLEKEIGSKFWKGDKKRFGTHGSQEGLFLLPNPNVKETWYPTDIKIKSHPFEALVSYQSNHYKVIFDNNEISVQLMNNMI